MSNFSLYTMIIVVTVFLVLFVIAIVKAGLFEDKNNNQTPQP
jgi:heme/copper-type cytochrome/quinol oxidase subunit 2